MDINEVRLGNYKQLLLQFRSRPDQEGLPEHGLLKRFADAGGLSVRYLSHINNGRKNIGHAFARQMEEGFGLETGWMDRDQSASPGATEAEREFLETSLKLFREAPVETQAMLMRFIMERNKKK